MESIEKLRQAASGCFEESTGDVIKNAMVLFGLDSPNTMISVLFNKIADEIESDLMRLTAERDALADDLLTCNRERECYRKAFGEAISKANEIVNLQP